LQLDWMLAAKVPHTRLHGEISFEDFGEVLASYQYQRIVETSAGSVKLDWRWPGNPGAFELVDTTGQMSIDVESGRFLKTSGAAEGTLRVVGILNLAEFVRRLSLDLSYAFESGIPFDSISGELDFDEGIVDVPKMDILGRTSRFQFVGKADVQESSVDGELVATLPIASNLPWIAALVSGLPAAVAVYVISKLFTKQFDQFSSAVYRVQGPWDDPAVDFQRIFDDSAKELELPAEEVKTESSDSPSPG